MTAHSPSSRKRRRQHPLLLQPSGLGTHRFKDPIAGRNQVESSATPKQLELPVSDLSAPECHYCPPIHLPGLLACGRNRHHRLRSQSAGTTTQAPRLAASAPQHDPKVASPAVTHARRKAITRDRFDATALFRFEPYPQSDRSLASPSQGNIRADLQAGTANDGRLQPGVEKRTPFTLPLFSRDRKFCSLIPTNSANVFGILRFASMTSRLMQTGMISDDLRISAWTCWAAHHLDHQQHPRRSIQAISPRVQPTVTLARTRQR